MAATAARVGAVLAWIAFTLVTNRWFDWDTGDRLYPLDAIGYQRIAAAAPHLPAVQTDAQHAQRLAPHYLVGLVAQYGGVDRHVVYDVAAALVLLGIVVVAHLILTELGLRPLLYVMCMGAVITNDYGFRFIASAPAMLAGGLFALGAGVTALATLRRSDVGASAGLVLAGLGRGDTLVLACAGYVVWLVIDARHGAIRRSRMARRALIVLAPAAATYVATNAIARSFSRVRVPGLSEFTVVGDVSRLPATTRLLADHVASTALGIVVPLALVVGVVLLLGLARAGAATRRELRAFGCGAILTAAIVLQPLVLGATWLGGSEPRLAAFALVPAVMTAGAALASADRALGRRLDAPALAACVAIALASLNPRYATVGPADDARQFAPYLVAAVLVCCGGWVVAGLRFRSATSPSSAEARSTARTS